MYVCMYKRTEKSPIDLVSRHDFLHRLVVLASNSYSYFKTSFYAFLNIIYIYIIFFRSFSVADNIEDPCVANVQCHLTFTLHSECRNNVCQCSSTAHFVNGRCYESIGWCLSLKRIKKPEMLELMRIRIFLFFFFLSFYQGWVGYVKRIIIVTSRTVTAWRVTAFAIIVNIPIPREQNA